MYEIATLKTKKLPELQEIAKKIGVKRIAGLKKLDLIYQIVDFIASKPDEETAATPPPTAVSKEEGQEKKAPLKIFPVQKSKPKQPVDPKQGVQKNPNNSNNKHQNKNNPQQGGPRHNGNNPEWEWEYSK